jgi:hypothetical protein
LLLGTSILLIPVLNIPPLFLPDFKGEKASFSWLKDPKVEKLEKVGEEHCYVISGSSAFSKKETFWISKTSYHIRKYCQSFEPPEGGRRIPGMTEKEIEREKKYAEEYNRSKISGSYTQVYTGISSPELNQDDFKYALPEKAYLRENWRIGN